MLSCFSLFANARLLSQAQTANSVSQNDDVTDIQCLHGMRVISMAWIILGHTFLGLFSSGILDTTINITAYPANVLWQPIGNAYFAVETFFFMSGLLVAYHGSKYLERNEGKINVISFTLQRYLRLLPLMSFMMLLWIGLKPYLGSGPVWYTQQEDPGCDQYWWSNLLFIQNFYPVNLEDACNGWTCGADLYENFIWSKPYNRLPPYITGFILGWYLTKPNQSQPTKITHWLISILACLALAVVVLAFFPLRMGFTYSHVFHATYGSLARCIWGVALSGITWSCIYNNNGFINKFLSCKAFIPLSRLTYGVYLFHPLLIFVIVFNHQSPIPFNDVTIMLHFITFLVLSFVAAAILNLLIEIPIQNLKKFLRSGASPLSE
ncbi:hypothetical protein CAPTEDRAFT_160691 [Capitella teleta]|uniref:Acyltransferase 3 domain-containing protein n=1 Tax=Capitella teleta TaxID=283909 RepID=R7TFQ8_CAPTE|nr:hypothetical protein CAPTEDRAFT_160691 [Capitella teleta]|eukprot:ELT92628.1 hypothetical protein CAPTEDRAFT_160691 [Capitella teleta]